jgi:hypothetical protein
MTAAHHTDGGAPDGCSEPDCLAALERGDRWIGPFLSVEPDGRAHFHHRDTLQKRVRANSAAQFDAVAATFELNPTDFVYAWRYLTEHPIFHRPIWMPGAGRTIEDLTEEELAGPPRFVDDSAGLQDMWMHIERDTEGETIIYLEHGPHLWPENIPTTEHWCTPADGIASHDLRLNVSANSYEEAIIALAGRVRDVYGNDRARV